MTTHATPMTEPQRALAIGAHPDDSEVGCGGTIAKLTRQGWDVTFIVCTNGNKGSHDPAISPYQLSEMREAEQRAAADVLGVQRVIFLRNNDGELEGGPALRAEIALYIRHFKPHLVFSHDPWRQYMLHPDHRVVGFGVIDGLVSARDHLYMPGLAQIGLLVWRPQTLYLWSAEQADHVEDIGDTLDQKTAALREHHSQFDRKEDLGEWVRTRAQQHGQAAGYAAGEAFKQISL
jgi:LmbE family N-acetylglucosaminyl deacetylase